MSFDLSIRTRVLLWCDRHCCLCKKLCGVNIEVAHIAPEAGNESDNIDNAIPLCFECHSEIGRYNDSHPKGNKYKPEELKARREQVYEEFTQHLVPPVHYEITNLLPDGSKRIFPDTGFNLTHYGDSLPVKVRTVIEIISNDGESASLSGHYSGEKLWNLNPRFSYRGHFEVPEKFHGNEDLRLIVSVTIIDQYERDHNHLPINFAYVRKKDYWYLDA